MLGTFPTYLWHFLGFFSIILGYFRGVFEFPDEFSVKIRNSFCEVGLASGRQTR